VLREVVRVDDSVALCATQSDVAYFG